MKPIFAPSLMCIDLLNIKNELDILNIHCGMMHADIMDGHFTKNITLSADFIKAIRRATALPIDAHLMVETPGDFVEMMALAGADYISVHAETIEREAFRIINKIHNLGCKVGVVLCPATGMDRVKPYLSEVDMLTIMTVDVGYAGQKFIPQMLLKIEEANEIRLRNHYSYMIQVDGAIGPQNYNKLYAAGANVFVMGTSGLFHPGVELGEACLQMKKEFSEATGVML